MKGTVLLLDDDEGAREGVRALLEHTGLEVHTTGSFVDFHSLIARHDPDLILVDIGLAALKGDAIVSIARNRLNSTTVVLFSGVSRVELVELAHKSGADGFLSKMDDTEEMLRKILSWVQQRRRSRGHDEDAEDGQ